MHTLLFWKTWTPVHQRLFWLCSTFLLLALAILWVVNGQSPGPVFTAQHFQELDARETPVHAFQVGTQALSVYADNYLVFDHSLGNPLKPNITGACIFLGALIMGIVILLSAITTLPRFWFYAGMGLFILFVVSLRLESLEVFGFTNKIPTAILLLAYGIAAYYLQFLRPSASLVMRLIIFFVLTLLAGALISVFAQIPEPFYYLSANSSVAAVVFTVLFVFTVAHEVVAAFITVITQARRPSKSLRHFLIVSLIYLVNLALLYADKKHLLSWHFYPFNLFLLISLSAILGVWGFRQREHLYDNIMKADPLGTLFFLALGGISLSTIGYALATANDPTIQFLQDVVLYSHIGYGLIFLVYTIVNFLSLLAADLPVYKVMYKPATMPYFTFRLAGLIATFSFFAYSNYQVSVNQVYAGYYNSIGDYYLAQDTLLPAESYYQRSVLFATRNYHAHYALAEIDASRWAFDNQKQELKKLAMGRPLDLGYLNYSRLFEVSGAWREAIQVLRLGLKDFPGNGLIQNALGLAYAKVDEGDSALLMINAARKDSRSAIQAETNLVGLSARFGSTFSADSLLRMFNPDNPGVTGNALVLATQQGNVLEREVDPESDTILTIYTAVALNNFLINHIAQADTTLTGKVVALARRPVNEPVKNLLLSAAAHVYYQQGEISRAHKLLHEVAFMGQESKAYDILGLWFLEQGALQPAIQFFDQALVKHFGAAYFHRALALTEAGLLAEANTAWDSLSKSKDPGLRREALRMKSLLKATLSEALAFQDGDKYEYSRGAFTPSQGVDFARFITTIHNPEIRARAIVDFATRQEKADEPEMALATLSLAKGLLFSDKNLVQSGQFINLRCLARQKQWPQLEQLLRSGISFNGIYEQQKFFFETLLKENSGEGHLLTKNFEWLGSVNPFFEDAVVEAARYMSENSDDKFKPYSILINALQLNPNSVKLLKAHFVQSAYLDLEQPAKESLDKLHKLLSREAFISFAKEHQDIFDISRH